VGDDGEPACFPGFRPDRVRDERFFAGFLSHGASEDGGRDDVEESFPAGAAAPRSDPLAQPQSAQHSQLSQHIHKGHTLGQLGNRHPKIITDPPRDADAGSSQLNSYPRACRCVFDLAVNNE
jgi:hypothetical protein